MTPRQSLLVLPLLVSCEVWKAPDRARELEKRVNELSVEVSAMAGRPVGMGKSAEAKPADDSHGDAHGDKEKDKDSKDGKDGKAPKTKGKADKEAAHDAKASDDAHDTHAAADDDHGVTKVAHPTPADPAKAAAKPAPHAAAHWGYGRKDGPEHWGEMSEEWAACSTGEQQSPIDITAKASEAPAITFHYQPSKGTVVDNGHTLQVNLTSGGEMEIEGHAYTLVQFHVHTPSEHTIAGEQYPLEVHLVHKDAAGKLAVIGVLFDSGDDTKAYDGIWGKWPAKVNVPVALKRAFDPTELLPQARSTYSYDGSLTTPPCTEGVLWNVMRRTKVAPRRLVDAFMEHHPDNARPVMPLGERTVL